MLKHNENYVHELADLWLLHINFLNEMIYMKWIIYWTVHMKSSKAMILAVIEAILAIA